MITRIAPTPSGFLHRGNAANVLLTGWLAASADGVVALRIDDLDAARARAEYVDDIFALLDWLEVAWQVGPRDRADLQARWSARHRLSRYRSVLDDAVRAGLPVYACTCSRTTQRGPATGGCSGGCGDRDLAWTTGRSALRLRVPPGTRVDVAGTTIDLATALGDFVIWRRDGLPAYQLASIVDDLDLGVTDVVRGQDLLPSSAAQIHLARHLGADTVANARYWHHDLVPGPGGDKLSKSQTRHGAPLPRTSAERDRVEALALALGAPIGISPPG